VPSTHSRAVTNVAEGLTSLLEEWEIDVEAEHLTNAADVPSWPPGQDALPPGLRILKLLSCRRMQATQPARVVHAARSSDRLDGVGDITPVTRKETAPRDWLSPTEAAAQLQVDRSTVRRWISDGVLPARQTRPGGQYRLDPTVVARFAAEQQQVRPKTRKEARTQPKAS
jgi:excisionase family DNA binding protein